MEKEQVMSHSSTSSASASSLVMNTISNVSASSSYQDKQSIFSIQGEKLVEIRPGRKIALYTSPSNDNNNKLEKEEETVILFVHGSMGNFTQYRYQIAHFGGKGDAVFGKEGSRVVDENEDILKVNVERQLSHSKSVVDRVVAFDYLGCGRSEKPKTGRELYATDELYLDLKEILNQYVLQIGKSESKKKNVFLVGHSFGTSMVLRLAEEFQDVVSGCILVATGTMDKDGGPPIFLLPEFFLRWIQPFLSRGFIEKAHHPSTLHVNGSKFHKDLIQRAYELSGGNDMYVVKSFYTQMKWARKQILQRLTKVPCLFIHGDDDKLLPIEIAKQVASWVGNKDLVQFKIVSEGGHQVMEERPDEVNKLIEDFIIAFSSRSKRKTNEINQSKL